MVYLSDSNFVLRVGRDGASKTPGVTGYAIGNVTANANGIIASANAHFQHSIKLWDHNFNGLLENNDFLNSDTVGWQGPAHVEAGQSGDFYGLDQNRGRIVRISPTGKELQTYLYDPSILADRDRATDFRVCESTQKLFHYRVR